MTYKLDNLNKFIEEIAGDFDMKVDKTKQKYGQTARNNFRRQMMEHLAEDLQLVETADGFYMEIPNDNDQGYVTVSINIQVKEYGTDSMELSELFAEEKAKKMEVKLQKEKEKQAKVEEIARKRAIKEALKNG